MIIYVLLMSSHKNKKSNDHIFLEWSYLPAPPLGQDMTQGHFLSGVLQLWIKSFPSLRLVASQRLKNLVCPTIYPLLEGEYLDSYLSQGY